MNDLIVNEIELSIQIFSRKSSKMKNEMSIVLYLWNINFSSNMGFRFQENIGWRGWRRISELTKNSFIIALSLMSNLQSRQEKIQAKRKQTSWRDFVMDICSWWPIVFYKNNNIVSKFPPTNRSSIIPHLQFDSNRDGLIDRFNIDEVSLFTWLQTLRSHTQLPSMMHWWTNENSDYVDIALGCQNSYLAIWLVTDVTNVLYSWSVKDYSSNVQNSAMVWKYCENIYSSISVIHSSNVFYSKFIDNCNNIRFSSNLLWCSECLFCDWLQNQSYCIYNQQFDKWDYFQEKLKLLSHKQQFQHHLDGVNGWASPILSENVSGNGIIESNDVENGYYIYNVHWGKNLFLWWAAEENRNIYDAISFWSPRCRDVYAWYSINAEYVYCSVHSAGSSYIFYSYFLENCSFCLWCIWLKNKSYCILNKQYTKEEWYEKVDEIFTQMEKDWQLWEFFPATMNPFYFNDTAAYLIDPSFTKEEVTAKWYLRRDEPIKVDIPEWMEVVKISELWDYEWFDSEWNRSINADILKKVIQDEEWNVYRIIPMEYKFLVKHGLPLPRKHWLERMKENFRIS